MTNSTRSFANRVEAGHLLAERLSKYENSNSIVVAIPRGGVPVGYIVSKQLGLPLDIFLVKKIGHPNNSEYAIGSVTLNRYSIDRQEPGVSNEYLQEQLQRIRNELQRRYRIFTGKNESTNFKNKSVILVDDGIATGSTLLAAVKSIREAGAEKIIIAVPVAPLQAAHRFKPLCDEYICLSEPYGFKSVGQYYNDFPQISDEEVVALLNDKETGIK
jgi:predicted phosphoribosyltransferase